MLELWRFGVTVPAGVLRTAPQTFSFSMPARRIEEIEVMVPPGPRGEVGFKIAQSGVQIYPAGAGDFIVTDNETIHWPLEGASTSGSWQALVYNTGNFPHTLEFRFLVVLPSGTPSAAPPTAQEIVPADQLGQDAVPPPVLDLPPAPELTAPPG